MGTARLRVKLAPSEKTHNPNAANGVVCRGRDPPAAALGKHP
jgi:hypothetical protein